MPTVNEPRSSGAGGHAYLFGLGSPHGRDRLGWLAAERLGAELAGRGDLSVACLGQPSDLFLHPLAAGDRLLLLDAMRGKGPPGTVMAFSPGELPDGVGTLSSHGIGLAGTLALVEALGLCRAGIRVVGIEMAPAGAAPTLGEGTARRLRNEVQRWLEAPPHAPGPATAGASTARPPPE
ncbi:hydrogenase maturation protease [Halomonas nitroreducens]|uniref:Hydrogenase maturation protease n=1 Tax=Halomonas nitroreducens TaxID=447425 RepID=A0A3S0JUX6_9GAMM|nr:hydrogenase maturation protease [Halomonas nitroreducens]RTR01097.1 hydrogenase maturation protease [Halomonas nitroreducens]